MFFKVTLYEVRPSYVEPGDVYDAELTDFVFPNIQEANLFAELCAMHSMQPIKVLITAESLSSRAEELIKETKSIKTN